MSESGGGGSDPDDNSLVNVCVTFLRWFLFIQLVVPGWNPHQLKRFQNEINRLCFSIVFFKDQTSVKSKFKRWRRWLWGMAAIPYTTQTRRSTRPHRGWTIRGNYESIAIGEYQLSEEFGCLQFQRGRICQRKAFIFINTTKQIWIIFLGFY